MIILDFGFWILNFGLAGLRIISIRGATRNRHGEKLMPKKLTITLDERVYEGLHAVVGRRRISRFIESLVRPIVVGRDLDAGYRDMARDEAREPEAADWAEGLLGDVARWNE
jgi:hypothetical protein